MNDVGSPYSVGNTSHSHSISEEWAPVLLGCGGRNMNPVRTPLVSSAVVLESFGGPAMAWDGTGGGRVGLRIPGLMGW